MTPRTRTVIDLDGPALTLARVSAGPDRAQVSRLARVTRPGHVPADDAAALGEWIAGELSTARCAPGRAAGVATIAIPRAHLVLKRLTVPALREDSPELIGAVRLAATRHLSISADGAAIDFLVLSEDGPPTPGVTVLAAALPAERVRWYKDLASAAGLKAPRLVPRACALAALLGETAERAGAPIIGVLPGPASVEVIVLEGGRLAAVRAADLPAPASDATPEARDAYAQRLGSEVRRAWTTHRMAVPGPDAEAVALLGEGPGEGDASAALAGVIAGALSARPITVASFPGLEIEPDASASSPGVGRSAAALCAALARSSPRDLDFARTRKPPDTNARTRQLALAGVLSVIVVGGLGWAFADAALGSRRAALAAAQQNLATLRADYAEFLPQDARVRHLETWLANRPAWSAHLSEITARLPDPARARVDTLRGSLSPDPAGDAAFVPASRSARYPDGAWRPRSTLVFAVDGRIEPGQREAVIDARAGFVGDSRYTVNTRGADAPERFAITLSTTDRAPQPSAPAPTQPPVQPSSPPAPPAAAATSPKEGA